MSTATRATIVAIVLLGAALTVWFVMASRVPLEPPGLATASGASALAAPSLEAPPAAGLARADDAGTRAEIALESPSQAAEAAPAVDVTARIDGRFVDDTGRGIARVRVVKPAQVDGAVVESNEQGEFLLTLAPGSRIGRQIFEAHAEGWATHFSFLTVEAGATFHRGQIVLVPGGTVAGTVVDENGRPLEGARILGTKPALDGDVADLRRTGPTAQWNVPETKSAADGSFRLDGVPAGLVRAWASREARRWAFSELLDIPARGVIGGVVLRLEPLADDDRIEGLVLDPDGQPVPRATIGYSYEALNQSGSSSSKAGDDGRFRIVLIRKVPHDLRCSPGEENWTSASLEDVPPGTLDAVLQMRAARMLDLLVRDEKSAPLGEFAFALRSSEGNVELWGGNDEPRADGRAQVKMPSMAFLMDVWARGRVRVTLGPIDPNAPPVPLVCTLEALPGVRGRVLHGTTPVAGARLMLNRMVPVEERYEHNGFLSRITGAVVESDVSDADGRFQVTVREPGTFALLCEAGGYALAEISPLEVDPRVGRDGIDVQVGAGGTLEGRVLAPTGREAAGVIVGISRFDCRARTFRVGADGRYRFEKLTPGGWTVRRATQELHPGSTTTSSGQTSTPVRFDADCVVEAGRVTTFDLDLRDAFDAVLLGHVTVNGVPATGWTVVAQDVGPSADFSLGPPTGVVNAQGDVRLALTRPTKFQIELAPVAETGTTLKFSRELEIHGGENHWVADLSCGTLEGVVTDKRESLLLECWSVDGGEWHCRGSVPRDASGRYRVAWLPVGQMRLTLRDRQSDGWRIVADKQVEISRAGTATLNIP